MSPQEGQGMKNTVMWLFVTGSITVLAALPTARATGTPAQVCQDDFMLFYESCYRLSTDSLTSTQALAACQALDASLVTIPDLQTNEFLGTLPFSFAAWIGYNDRNVESVFEWTDGSPATFTNWASNQPIATHPSLDCVRLNSNTGLWQTSLCNSPVFQYICQRPATVVSTSNITSVMSTSGNSPFPSSTTVTYVCLAETSADSWEIVWLGPDGRNASDSTRITTERSRPTNSSLNLTMVITEGRTENSGQYTCVVRDTGGEVNQSVTIVFQVILALDGLTGSPFEIQFIEGSSELELLSFQHLAGLIGQEPICSVSLQLSNSGPLNDPSQERILPTKIIEDDSGELMTSHDMIRYTKATLYSQPDLLTILRNQEYFNFADEIIPGQRTVTWKLSSCGSNVTVATGITRINPVHVNDSPPVIQLRSASVVV